MLFIFFFLSHGEFYLGESNQIELLQYTKTQILDLSIQRSILRDSHHDPDITTVRSNPIIIFFAQTQHSLCHTSGCSTNPNSYFSSQNCQIQQQASTFPSPNPPKPTPLLTLFAVDIMVEAHSWTTRRMSNPRLDSDSASDHLLSIPTTPPSDARYSPPSSAVSPCYCFFGRMIHLSPSLVTTVAVASWYFSNIGVLLLNKYLLSIYGFRYPIFLTMLHMVACSIYSYLAIRLLGIVPFQQILSRRQFLKIFGLSAIFCFSVVCGNTSLRYIPVSFNQAIGATTPFFTAIFAFLITCKKETAEVYLALLPVVFGIVLASNSEPLFHLFGFLVCVGSTAGRALKSVVQGILLTSDSEKLHSMNLLLYMAPMAAMILLPITFYIEGNVAAITVEKARGDNFIVVLLIGNATVAYLVNLTNFMVTKYTSALTLQVLGNAKAAVAAVVSVLIFRNPVTVMGMTGFAVTVMGVVLYSEAKKRSKGVSR